MANKNLPVIIVGIGAIALLVAGLSGNASAETPTQTNPDKVNHPDAALINGVWRDSTSFYDPKSRTWKPITTTPAVSGMFDMVMPENTGFAVSSYLSIMLRMTEGYEKFQPGDRVKITHANYQGKTGSITKKIVGEAGGNYIVVNVLWNFLAIANIIQGPYSIPINKAGGQLAKL